jgi:hypothetical protein
VKFSSFGGVPDRARWCSEAPNRHFGYSQKTKVVDVEVHKNKLALAIKRYPVVIKSVQKLDHLKSLSKFPPPFWQWRFAPFLA